MAQAKQKAEPDTNGHEDNVTPISSANGFPKELEPDPDYVPTYELRKLNAGDTA